MKRDVIGQSVYLVLVMIMLVLPPLVHAEGFSDFNGKQARLSDYTGKGKWTVVMIWASDCRVCNHEAYQYVDFNLAHSDKDARVVGISLDGKEKLAAAKRFVQKHDVDFPNLIAEPEEAAEFYHQLTGQSFVGTPSFLIYAPDGKLKAAQAGAVPAELIEQFIESQSVAKAAGTPSSPN